MRLSRHLLAGFGGLLRLETIMIEALSRLVPTALSDFSLFFGVSCAGGHGVLLRTVLLWMMGAKETMPHQGWYRQRLYGADNRRS
jgi:hypothetical protein